MGTDDKVADGSDTHDIILTGIGKKQMGQSSLAGGSLNSASSCISHVVCSIFDVSTNDSSGTQRYNT